MNIRGNYRKMKRIVNYKKAKYPLAIQKCHKRSVILMGGPEYGNLGDHAIAYATKKFIQKNCGDLDYIELSESDILYNIKNIKDNIKEDDILLLQGGGNTGDLYPDQEKVRKKVLRHFPENKIILMPQTIYFKGEMTAKQYYNRNKLTLCAREDKSYEIMRTIYECSIIKVPDIVLSLYNNILEFESKPREGALICLRDDCEKNMNGVNTQKILEYLEKKHITNEFTSTVKDYGIKINDRERELNVLFDQFLKSRLVITDRLHGMIIAAITKTPCIVLPTFNHKVTESFKWIKELEFLELCDDIMKIEKSIDNVLYASTDNDFNLEDKFIPLVMEMKKDEKIY